MTEMLAKSWSFQGFVIDLHGDHSLCDYLAKVENKKNYPTLSNGDLG
jgi:hypothetical protein